MKLSFPRGITFKMTLLVLGGTAAVFTFVLAYSYIYSRKMMLAEAEESARNLTLSVARRIEQEFRAVAEVPPEEATFLDLTTWDKTSLLRLIRRMVQDHREIFGSSIAFEPFAFEPDKRFFAPYYYRSKKGIAFEQLGSKSYDYIRKDWYHVPKVLKAPVWSEPYFDEGGGGILMTTYSYPFFEKGQEGQDKKVRAIITADVSLDWLTKLVGSIRVGKSGYCFIVSDTGKIVTHPQRQLIMVESLFSLAEELHDPRFRTIGRAMIHKKSGFMEFGSTLSGEDSLLAFARIPTPGWSLGTVFPKRELLAKVTMLHQTTMLLATGGILLLLAVSLVISRSLTRPLVRMAQATARVAKGDLDLELNQSDIRRQDEVGLLAQHFKRMVAGLKERDRIRDTFGRYLTQEVVNRLLESKTGLKLGGESREISMIMSDLRGFTALTSNMPPEQVIAFLNRYLGKMVEILIDYRGIIDEIIGDGILAFFGAPESLEDHPGYAVACALTMQASMGEINARNEIDGWPHLDMGVAVNTGEVVVGNIGSEKRTKYGAVGSQVNFTGRIESFTVGGQVLISESTYSKLSDILDVRNVLNIEMKGVPGKVKLYDVRGIGEPYNVRLPERNDTPVPPSEKVYVQVYRLNQKIVTGTYSLGWFRLLSLSSGVLALDGEIKQWEDVRIELVNDQQEPIPGQSYAKVVSVKKVGDEYEAEVRFTSVSPEAYKVFRRATGTARKESA
ncbi:MAG: adenylate/guanylate cyclase domain-containing protein [Deltaproteobacteria bacterium]